MRILYHHRIASKDGQYVHVEELVSALRRAGHEVYLVGPKTVATAEFGSQGKLIKAMKDALPRFIYELLEFGYGVMSYVRLRSEARKRRPDIIYERYNLLLPAGIWVSRHLHIPLILEVNAPLFEERDKYDGISLKGLARWSQKYVWCNADACLPVTAVLGKYLEEAGVPEHRITIVHNGVDLSKYEDLPDKDQAKRTVGASGDIVLGFVGFVRRWHGLDAVIKMMNDPQFHGANLVVVGDGPARAELEDLATQLGLYDRVHFTGLVSRRDVLAYMRSFDIALQPDVVSYASPLKLFEYMALGLPIIAPDTPNIREVLTDQKDALLVTIGDAAAMQGAMLRLVRDLALRESLGQAVRKELESAGYTWDSNASRVVAIGEDLVSAAQSRELRPDG